MTQHKWRMQTSHLQHSGSECTRGNGVDHPQSRKGVKVHLRKQTVLKGSPNISMTKKELFAANSVPRHFFARSICSDMKDYVWPARSCNFHDTYSLLDTKEKPFCGAICSAGFAWRYHLPFRDCTLSDGGGDFNSNY